MKALLQNHIAISGIRTFEELAHIKRLATFNNPAYQNAIRAGNFAYGLDKTVELYQTDCLNIQLPIGFLDKIPLMAIEDNRHTHDVEINTCIQTRSYQERCIRLALANGGGVIVAPTGAGKTTMAIELASRLGQRCLVLVNKTALANQWIAAIKQFSGLSAGLIGGGKWQEGEQFTIALAQTLDKHHLSLDYGLIIVDECHNAPADQAYRVINRQKAMYKYGLSATPQRRDNLEFMIHAALGDIVAEVECNELNGKVLPVKIHTLNYDFQGDPHSWSQFINQLAEDDFRNELIINSAIKAAKLDGTVCLSATVSHAEKLHSMAIDRGFKALLLHGKLPAKQKAAGLLAAPDYPLIFGTQSLLSEGIDLPHLGNVIFATPVSAAIYDRETPAATRLIQTIGRGRRPFKSRKFCNVLDIVDSHPLGKSAFKKRAVIYHQQNFSVRGLKP